MATETTFILSDDLDSRIQNGVETVTFYDPSTGRQLEIELGEANRKHLAAHIEKLAKYVGVARDVTPVPTKAVTAQKGNQAKIREWAQANGYTVGDRGRIKADIVNAYNVAHNEATPVESDSKPVEAEPVTALTDPENVALVEVSEPTQTVTPAAQAKAEEIAADIAAPREPLTNDDILAMMAELDAEKGDVTLKDLADKVAE